MANDQYNRAAERLWEKLEAHRGKYQMICLRPGDFAPWDKFCERNPEARGLAAEVNKEMNYELSEYQCSWAVVRAYSNTSMDDYNRENKTSLRPRA